MSKFVKIGENLIPKPKGADYDLIPGKVYDLTGFYDPTLRENGDLNIPEKLYETEKDDKFRKLVISRFKTNPKLGVLLYGEKGTGKSIQAKLIAKESGLPIIIIPSRIHKDMLIKFFKSFETPVCVIFDEFDKYFETEDLLPLLDGIEKTTSMLTIFTCNNLDEISDYLKDRCSRIRYMREFTIEDNEEFIPQIISELNLTEYSEELNNFCTENIKYPTIDNIKTFLTEYKYYLDEGIDITPLEVAEFLNITLK